MVDSTVEYMRENPKANAKVKWFPFNYTNRRLESTHHILYKLSKATRERKWTGTYQRDHCHQALYNSRTWDRGHDDKKRTAHTHTYIHTQKLNSIRKICKVN